MKCHHSVCIWNVFNAYEIFCWLKPVARSQTYRYDDATIVFLHLVLTRWPFYSLFCYNVEMLEGIILWIRLELCILHIISCSMFGVLLFLEKLQCHLVIKSEAYVIDTLHAVCLVCSYYWNTLVPSGEWMRSLLRRSMDGFHHRGNTSTIKGTPTK